jgi:putative oxidoreductase
MFKQLEGLEKWGWALLQLPLGLLFFLHGSQKLFGPGFYGQPWDRYIAFFERFGVTPGAFWIWVVALTEFFGGICIFFGLLTRIWAAGLVIDMIVAVLKVHVKVGFFWTTPGGGLEFPLTLGLLALALVLMGPSFLSVDRMIGLEKRVA